MKVVQCGKISIAILSLALVTLFARNSVRSRVGQQSPCKQPELRRQVYEEGARPKSKIGYSESVRFKLGSRKTIYRRGEMITVDLAMLNTSGSPLFVHRLIGPYLRWKVHAEAGQPIPIEQNLLVLEGVSAQSFDYLTVDDFATGSFQLLAGCDIGGLRDFQEAHQKLNRDEVAGRGKSNKAVFDRDLFVSWGDACLSLTAPGTYLISAEISNEFVIASPCEPLAKTAVGTIESTPFKIVIKE